MIPRRRIDLHLAIRSTRHQHGDLSLQRNSLLNHASSLAQRLPCSPDLILNDSAGTKPDLTLPLPVITTRRAFAKAFPAQRRHRLTQLIERPHRPILAYRESVFEQPILLFNPVLNHRQHRSVRPHRRIACRRLHARGRDLFNLQRHNIASTREIRCLPRIIPPCFDASIHDKTRRTSRVRIEHQDAIAHTPSCNRRHPAQLAAPKNPNCRTRQNRLRDQRTRAHAPTSSSPTTCASTSSRRAARQETSLSCNAASVVASIATASNPAFIAPDAPIASVPTGTPFGICTILSSESSPWSAVAGMGTPSTGTTVFAAIIPGRCAAPPAPAMITRRPRPAAASAYSNSRSGVRCAETTRTSCPTPNFFSTSTVPRITA